MATVFQVRANEQKEYFFNLVDDQGEVLLLSADYPDREELNGVIADVRVGTLMSNQIAAGKTKSGEMFFLVKDGNGQVIAKSPLFSTRMSLDNALHSVKDNACVAEIADLTA